MPLVSVLFWVGGGAFVTTNVDVIADSEEMCSSIFLLSPKGNLCESLVLSTLPLPSLVKELKVCHLYVLKQNIYEVLAESKAICSDSLGLS